MVPEDTCHLSRGSIWTGCSMRPSHSAVHPTTLSLEDEATSWVEEVEWHGADTVFRTLPEVNRARWTFDPTCCLTSASSARIRRTRPERT
jgi:hypothetical protein